MFMFFFLLHLIAAYFLSYSHWPFSLCLMCPLSFPYASSRWARSWMSGPCSMRRTRSCVSGSRRWKAGSLRMETSASKRWLKNYARWFHVKCTYVENYITLSTNRARVHIVLTSAFPGLGHCYTLTDLFKNNNVMYALNTPYLKADFHCDSSKCQNKEKKEKSK